VRIPEDLLFSTLRITTVDDQGAGKSIGTGFMCRVRFDNDTKQAMLLVSNRHVLGADEAVVMNFHQREPDRQAPLLGKTVPLILPRDVYKELYVPHPDPDVDLACLNLTNLAQAEFPLYWRSAYPEMFATFKEQELTVGEEVAFVGYPEGRFDTANNLPLVRFGHISSVPAVDFNDQPVFVVDAPVFQGSSGSPVIWWHEPVDGGEATMRLLGVMTATMIRHERLETVKTAQTPYVQQMIGLGIVIKVTALQELLDAVAEKAMSGWQPRGGIELLEAQHPQPS
jgi:hypothetical protein